MVVSSTSGSLAMVARAHSKAFSSECEKAPVVSDSVCR